MQGNFFHSYILLLSQFFVFCKRKIKLWILIVTCIPIWHTFTIMNKILNKIFIIWKLVLASKYQQQNSFLCCSGGYVMFGSSVLHIQLLSWLRNNILKLWVNKVQEQIHTRTRAKTFNIVFQKFIFAFHLYFDCYKKS